MQRTARTLVVSLVASAAWSLSASPASPQTRVPRRVPTPHAVVELVADWDDAGRSGTLWVGVRFELDPHWHIYWQNPGDAGSPPEVAWTLPTGMSAGAIEWPAPERIDAQGVVSYGYSGVVVLPVRMETAGRVADSGPMRIGAALKWLVCSSECVSGHARVEMPLPTHRDDATILPGWRTALADARARVPGPAPSGWRTSARSVSDSFVV
jgi:DsbC/DsbD-like thiol-disulfide interchange protein